ncbi:hypothetical protein EV141_1816 [Microcella putealis]|uniref:Uncharacterized protein n=1 Tax=Microcella putealis TaxID=337005 RepID=A0A4Q7LQK5_9MICO|nr:hypothetical protein [Microcella putealis]RZS56357.1 hypothetical protein EV141_1816 [Microcella putealis]TQM27157.1 hypothetical protein BJ957_0585 [Microcella putealis]
MARTRNPLNPFNDTPGFWGAFGRLMWKATGPAAVGAGREEAPYEAPTDPTCPLCGRLMAEHTVARGVGTTPSRLRCPVPSEAPA